jgi:hypothetical protein
MFPGRDRPGRRKVWGWSLVNDGGVGSCRNAQSLTVSRQKSTPRECLTSGDLFGLSGFIDGVGRSVGRGA